VSAGGRGEIRARMEPGRARPVDHQSPRDRERGLCAANSVINRNRGKVPSMGVFTKDIKTFDDLFLHQLRDIYYAEKQIVKKLPGMIEKATNRDLTTGLKDHLEQTKRHVERLEEVFKKLGKEAKAVDCPAIDGILKEADETSGEIEDKEVLDAGIIASAQAVEHYEITKYGTLIAWAHVLGHDSVVTQLSATLKEEGAADKKLTTIAESKKVNRKAAS
jgi:ferritin-like metal-binding protein YciE